MSKLTRFWALPAGRRHLLCRAIVLLAVARLGLLGFPLGLVRRALAALAWRPVRRLRGSGLSPADVHWSTTRASKLVPGADTCLYRACVAEALLRGSGAPAALVFGFGRDDAGRVRGHAWTESHGAAVTVADSQARYRSVVRLPSPGQARPGNR